MSSHILLTSLTFVCGLAWNTAIVSLFEQVTILRAGGPWVYAILVTVLTALLARAHRSDTRAEPEAPPKKIIARVRPHSGV